MSDDLNNIIAAQRPIGSARETSSFGALQKLTFWRRQFGLFITSAQILADFVTVVACFLASYWIYDRFMPGRSPQTWLAFSYLALGAGAFYVFLLDRQRLYRREISLLNVKELRGIFYVGFYAALGILSLSFYVRSITLSRITFTIALLSTPVLLYLQRQLFYQLHVLFHQRGLSQRRVFVFGAGNIGTQLAKRLYASPSLGLLPVAFLDDASEKKGQSLTWKEHCPKGGVPVLGGQEMIGAAGRFGVDLVMIALPSASFERNQRLVEMCIDCGIDYAIVPNAYEKFIQRVEMYEIGGIPLIRRRSRVVSIYYIAMKRLIDLVLSTFFIAVLSPFVLLAGIAIKLDSTGPVLFKQKRVGLRGKEFSFYKFRSMYLDAPKYARTPADPRDPRITKVGRWLRRTSLDELPQLFNVFRGDMSLVGPRPEMPFIVETYSALERQRLEAKPGITGVWQISAVRGEPIHVNIEYDLFYLENRSILLDVAIIVKTILSVVRGIGAY